ncbi:MAG: hypothetical protein U0401_18665 [Anaerolineae bacterium]
MVEDVVDIIARNGHFLPQGRHACPNCCLPGGERRYRDLLDRFGLETVRASMASIFATTEAAPSRKLSPPFPMGCMKLPVFKITIFNPRS